MEKSLGVKKLIKFFSEKSFVPVDYFHVDDVVIEKSICDFQGDYARWFPSDSLIDINKLILIPQLSSLLCYRIARQIKALNNSALQMGAEAFSLLGRQLGQIEIYYTAEIGHSFKINYGVGSVIGARCKIGSNCTIHQNCTVGDRNGGRPTIGNNVIMYAGSMILGDIHIGDNCIIGANSVITHDCPSNSVIVGTPGKIIRQL